MYLMSYLETWGGGAGYFMLLSASGFVFLGMTVFSFIGDDGHDVPDAAYDDILDGDFGEDADIQQGLLKYLSFRNCVNYLLGFGFCGFTATLLGAHPILSGALALSGGFLCALIMYKLMAALRSPRICRFFP